MHPQWRRLGSRIEYGIVRPRVGGTHNDYAFGHHEGGGAQCLTADASWSLCCLPSMGPSGWDSWLVVEQATLLRRGTLHERIFSH
jgi:hypothetical protein